MSLYTELNDAGLVLGNHQSDLHAKDTAEAREILAKYPEHMKIAKFTTADNGDGPMIDIPFAFEPWWEKRTGRA